MKRQKMNWNERYDSTRVPRPEDGEQLVGHMINHHSTYKESLSGVHPLDIEAMHEWEHFDGDADHEHED